MIDIKHNDTARHHGGDHGADQEQIKSLLKAINVQAKEQILPEAVASGLISQPSVEDDLAALRMSLSPIAIPDEEGIASFIKQRMSNQKGVKLRFDSIAIPLISLDAYITRLKKLFYCSSECFILALVYLDRLQELHDSIRVNCFNVHRLFLVALLVAVKFFDDVCFSNDYYAKVGGIGTKELSYLETYLLHLIKYDLFVSPAQYEEYITLVQTRVSYWPDGNRWPVLRQPCGTEVTVSYGSSTLDSSTQRNVMEDWSTDDEDDEKKSDHKKGNDQ